MALQVVRVTETEHARETAGVQNELAVFAELNEAALGDDAELATDSADLGGILEPHGTEPGNEHESGSHAGDPRRVARHQATDDGSAPGKEESPAVFDTDEPVRARGEV